MGRDLRKPTVDDLDACSRLIYLSGPHLYSYIFVLDEPEIYGLIKFMLTTKGMYSMRHAIIDVDNGAASGMCLAYPAKEIKEMTKEMMRDLGGFWKILGIRQFIIMMSRLKLNSYFPKTRDDEFFISNIAVFEQYRGKGIAPSLLEKTGQDALELGINKLSLFVEIDNSNAIQFYQKLAFREEERVVLPVKYQKYGLLGFTKMVKEI
jgi:ribosomal protein S18 acetylase RimI-like enzyme